MQLCHADYMLTTMSSSVTESADKLSDYKLTISFLTARQHSLLRRALS